MSVTGLPAAADNALSTLLATEKLSSWKVDGTEHQTVIVLRFTRRQPYAIDNTKASFRRKPPSQVSRDRDRAQRHREYMNAYSTHHSSGPLELNGEDNPCDSANVTLKGHRIVAPSQPSTSPVTSDPLQSDQCVDLVIDEFSEPADKKDSCVAVDQPQPQPGHAEDSSYEELPATAQVCMAMEQLNKKMEQISATLKSCVGRNTSGDTPKNTGIRIDSDREGRQINHPRTRDPSKDSLAPSRVPRQAHPPPQTPDNNSHRSGSHDDRPTATRQQRKRTTRRT